MAAQHPGLSPARHRDRQTEGTAMTAQALPALERGAPRNYEASPLRRVRATKSEMEERAAFLINYAEQSGPVTVRGLYYQAEVALLPGVDKTENGYNKVQRQVLLLRRAGRLGYGHISDATRWMRKPTTYDSIEDALSETARTYRRNLWRDINVYIEVWVEKDALAGVIYPITNEYDVPLMVSRGFASETFAFEAIAQRASDPREYHVYYFGDFDRSGQDAARTLREKLERFAAELPQCRCRVIFHLMAITEEQVNELTLPTRPHKRQTAADRAWPHEFACELDAMPPNVLRALVRHCIERHLPQHQLEILKIAEESERSILRQFVDSVVDGGCR
jgi:hypothetical protein